jgi:hypothetical protein
VKVCIVAHGPSAENKAGEIDACDFVVRMLGFKTNGALDQGVRTDALAHFAWDQQQAECKCECWYTHCPEQLKVQGDVGQKRLKSLIRVANMGCVRWLSDDLWRQLRNALGRHPSTGIVAVAMAMHVFQPATLVLYGYDSTTLDRPNYADARRPLPEKDCQRPPHNMLAEKQLIARIGAGYWLGKECRTQLVWPDKPDLT